MPDVIFFECFREEEDALRRYLPECLDAELTGKTIQDYDSAELPAPLISVRTQSTIPASWAADLKGILTRSVGYDHLRTYLRQANKPILCGYLPSYCARAVAEQAMLMALALLRKLRIQMNHFDTFYRDGLTGEECSGRNLFVAGVGRIGSEIVDIGRGLRMQVKGFDEIQKIDDLEYVSLEAGLAWADVIICALSLNDETRGLLDYNTFRRGKKGGVFINVARGEISPSKDLCRLIEEGILKGLGLDVFEEEPLLARVLRDKQPAANEGSQAILALRGYDNVIFTPHNAFNTRESVERKAKLSAEAVKMFLEQKTFLDLIPEE